MATTRQIGRGLAAIGLATLLLAQFPSAVFAQSLLETLEAEISDLVQRARPSVVTVVAVEPRANQAGSRGFLGFIGDQPPPAEEIRVGSGLILSSDGFILTKKSVVRDARHIEVSLHDGRQYLAEFVQKDSLHGIALLKINAQGLTPARIGRSSALSPGSWIVVIGNAYGVPQSVSTGVISAVQPNGSIQIFANIVPGSGGSPVFSTRGEVIGLVAGQLGLENQGPQNGLFSNTAVLHSLDALLLFLQNAVAQYYATHAWMGVTLEGDKTSGGKPRITELVEDAPAQKAGLQLGDVITHLDGRPVNSLALFATALEQTRPNQKIALMIRRIEQEVQVTLVLGQRHPIALNQLQLLAAEATSPAEGEARISREREPYRETYLLQRRIDALEKEVKALQSIYFK